MARAAPIIGRLKPASGYSEVLRFQRLVQLFVLQRRSYARPAAALHANGCHPRTESIELDAHLVHPFRDIGDRHRSPTDEGSIEEHLCVSRAGHDLDGTIASDDWRHRRLWSRGG